MSTKRLVYVAGLSSDLEIGSFVRQDMDNMKSIMENYENEGQIILRTDENVTKSDILRRFRDNKILPWLFYYSGHSDNKKIAFSDGHVSADTFVRMFENNRIQEALQLVYLGSCDSMDIGNQLIEKKVKVVIASNKKVKAHLANIVSKLFFYRFFITKNIQEAFSMTRNDYDFDRSTFNVNETTDFPWELITSSETNLEKTLKPIRLSVEQKHQLVMNSTNIRLELLNYYLKEDDSPGIDVNGIKEETSKIKDRLNTTLNITNENENVKSLIHLWKDSPTINLIPDNGRILRTSKMIGNLKLPENFMELTKNRVSNMIDLSENILTH